MSNETDKNLEGGLNITIPLLGLANLTFGINATNNNSTVANLETGGTLGLSKGLEKVTYTNPSLETSGFNFNNQELLPRESKLGLSKGPSTEPKYTVSFSPSETETVTVTQTPTLTQTVTQSPTVTQTVTQTPIATKTVTQTPSVTQTVTETPLATKTVTETPLATKTVVQTPTSTKTVVQTPLGTKTITQTPSIVKTVTQTPTSTKTVTHTPTSTVTTTQTETSTIIKSQTITPIVSSLPTLNVLTPNVSTSNNLKAFQSASTNAEVEIQLKQTNLFGYNPYYNRTFVQDPDRDVQEEDDITFLGSGFFSSKGTIQTLEHKRRLILWSNEDLLSVTKPLEFFNDYFSSLQYRYETLQKNVLFFGEKYNPTYFENIVIDTTEMAIYLSLNKTNSDIFNKAYSLQAIESNVNIIDNRLLQSLLMLRASQDSDSNDLLFEFYLASQNGYKCKHLLGENNFLPSIVKNIWCERVMLNPKNNTRSLTIEEKIGLNIDSPIEYVYNEVNDRQVIHAFFIELSKMIWESEPQKNKEFTSELALLFTNASSNGTNFLLNLEEEDQNILNSLDEQANNFIFLPEKRIIGYSILMNSFIKKYLFEDFFQRLKLAQIGNDIGIIDDVLKLFINNKNNFNANLAFEFLKGKKSFLAARNLDQYEITLKFIKKVYFVACPLFEDYVVNFKNGMISNKKMLRGKNGINSSSWINSMDNVFKLLKELDDSQEIKKIEFHNTTTTNNNFSDLNSDYNVIKKQWNTEWRKILLLPSLLLGAYYGKNFFTNILKNTIKALFYYRKDTILIVYNNSIIRAIVCPKWNLRTLKKRMKIPDENNLKYFDIVKKEKITIPEELLDNNMCAFIKFKKTEGYLICFTS